MVQLFMANYIKWTNIVCHILQILLAISKNEKICKIVFPCGFEPPTSGSETLSLYQLSYQGTDIKYEVNVSLYMYV